MVANKSSPHLKMFGDVSKRLSVEMSEILISEPKFRFGVSMPILPLLSKNINFAIFANYQLSCFILSINQSIYLHQTTWIHITIKDNTMK